MMGLPASKLRLTVRAQPRRAGMDRVVRASGRTCSISSANRMAKKLMAQ
jgi:hypothetical protein